MNGFTPNEPRAWTARYWWTMAIAVFLAQLALIVIFGSRHPGAVQPVARVPTLQLAGGDNEFVAVSDPTLFALPHANDFGAAIRRQAPSFPPPLYRWTESPRWLALANTDLLNTFGRFMRTNAFVAISLDFKPEPIFSEPALPSTTPPRPRSTVTFRGDLARRPFLHSRELPDWPETDVIAPSKVQVLVDTAGRVISTVLLPPDYGVLLPTDYGIEPEIRDANADKMALDLARAARFAPAGQVTVGQMIFNWHAVPIAATATNPPVKPQ